jgi:hypothetical protein
MLHEAGGEAFSTASAKVYVDVTLRQIQRELFCMVERRFCELEAKFDQMTSGGKPPKDFKFASERECNNEPVELPKFLS